MSVKSSRFSRRAYSRRAAQLADELADWQRIYHNRVMSNGDLGEWVADIAVYQERDRVLAEAVGELRDLSFVLLNLR